MGSMFGSTSTPYIPNPSTPSGATDVSSGSTSDGETVLTKTLEKQRKRRGVASTMRSSASSSSTDSSGAKTKLGG